MKNNTIVNGVVNSYSNLKGQSGKCTNNITLLEKIQKNSEIKSGLFVNYEEIVAIEKSYNINVNDKQKFLKRLAK